MKKHLATLIYVIVASAALALVPLQPTDPALPATDVIALARVEWVTLTSDAPETPDGP